MVATSSRRVPKIDLLMATEKSPPRDCKKELYEREPNRRERTEQNSNTQR